MNKNIKTFISCDAEYIESDIVLFGAGFDGTTSFRPGTRFAPDAIRTDSEGLETYSPYFDIDIEDKSISDIGDLELVFGDTNKVLDTIYKTSQQILKDNKKPFLIGGEHLVTYPQVKALTEKYDDLHIIHLDAHTDLREDYLGQKMSHASVIKRCSDLVGKNKIFQFGIRSGLKEEFEFAKKNHYIELFSVDTISKVLPDLKGKKVYITIDLDVLDPSVFPGTGTPEPGGITYKELQNFLLTLKGLDIVGCDVVELSPTYDHSGVSTAVACKVIRELLCLI